jgi:hypothetical protein
MRATYRARASGETFFGVAAFGRKPPFEFLPKFAALCRDAATGAANRRGKSGGLLNAKKIRAVSGMNTSKMIRICFIEFRLLVRN